MNLHDLVAMAKTNGASDLHLEPGLPAAIRVRGTLKVVGAPLSGKELLDDAREIIGPEGWEDFLRRRSYDMSKSIAGVRCRINVLHSSRGVGLAVRLLMSFTATIDKLNLHPDLKKLIMANHGLILVSGPTGSGKSSTLAAMIQEINLLETRHIVTIESPIEYQFKPHHAYIRQREVGRDTPSFEQALLDAMREDPDVLMVGEMREPETMRLTLNAAETGHLVLATVHSSTANEAIQRVVAAFASEVQNGVAAQIADCLVAVVSQRLMWREDLKMQVPECEILMPTHAAKNFIRRGEFYKIVSTMETGADSGMWTYQRYRNWLDQKKTWHKLNERDTDELLAGGYESEEAMTSALPLPSAAPVAGAPRAPVAKAPVTGAAPRDERLEIQPEAGGLEAIISQLKNKAGGS